MYSSFRAHSYTTIQGIALQLQHLLSGFVEIRREEVHALQLQGSKQKSATASVVYRQTIKRKSKVESAVAETAAYKSTASKKITISEMKKASMAMSTPVMILPFGGSKHMSYGTIIVQNMTAKSEVLSGGQRTGAGCGKIDAVRTQAPGVGSCRQLAKCKTRRKRQPHPTPSDRAAMVVWTVDSVDS
jgi:hypothetical protein